MSLGGKSPTQSVDNRLARPVVYTILLILSVIVLQRFTTIDIRRLFRGTRYSTEPRVPSSDAYEFEPADRFNYDENRPYAFVLAAIVMVLMAGCLS
ncbi:hypothetical protein CAAN1_21S02300 [[Candida] anglica]|uniref:Uncharacterized protein n=1 Tax=[Candida] anglica TaxID=148631 RepID=A0ABP0EFB2_9ASCO